MEPRQQEPETDDLPGGWQHEVTRALTVREVVRRLTLRADEYDRLPEGGRLAGDVERAGALRAVAADLPRDMGVAKLLEMLQLQDEDPEDDGPPYSALMFRCYPCPVCGSRIQGIHNGDCARWALKGTGEAPRPIVITPPADGVADLPCGCIVTELRVGVRPTADGLGAEAYCMVCDTTLAGVDVVAVQR